jgi:transposase
MEFFELIRQLLGGRSIMTVTLSPEGSISRSGPREQRARLSAVLVGHYAYYGITGNIRRLRQYRHQVVLLRLHLNQIDALDAAMATIDAQVEANLGPFRTAVELIMSIPGIKNLSAHLLVSEIGIDMSRFPSGAHLISWACICRCNDESAGKRRSTRVRKGALIG